MKLGDICELTYAYEADPYDPSKYRAIAEPALWLQKLSDGREEVLLTNGQLVRCAYHRLSIYCFRDNPAYPQRRNELYPSLDPARDQEMLAGVMVPDEGEAV